MSIPTVIASKSILLRSILTVQSSYITECVESVKGQVLPNTKIACWNHGMQNIHLVKHFQHSRKVTVHDSVVTVFLYELIKLLIYKSLRKAKILPMRRNSPPSSQWRQFASTPPPLRRRPCVRYTYTLSETNTYVYGGTLLAILASFNLIHWKLDRTASSPQRTADITA